MHFVYDGFTHNGEKRSFLFRAMEANTPAHAFRIEVDLLLFTRNAVPVQEGPMFCLQMLNAASLSGSAFLDKFHSYCVVNEDFRPLLVEREKRAAEKALKVSARRPFRKPPVTSNLRLGIARQP